MESLEFRLEMHKEGADKLDEKLQGKKIKIRILRDQIGDLNDTIMQKN